MAFIDKLFGTFSDKELKKIRPLADKVVALEPRMAAMSDEELQAMTPAFRSRLAAGETLDDLLPEAFAVCREASVRVLGMKHYPVQIIGGIALHRGRIAEMCTGAAVPPETTVIGALARYVANAGTGFQPMNANFGLLPGASGTGKKERKKYYHDRAVRDIMNFASETGYKEM